MRGMSLVELLLVLFLISLFVVLSTANLAATQRQLDFDQFAREIAATLETCRWKALNERCYTGVVAQQQEGIYTLSYFKDGNKNGILKQDIRQGIDVSFHRATSIYRASGDMQAAILDQGVPEIPPKKGILIPGDPVRFGKSDIISFSPDGDSSSGTLYLACQSQSRMYAVVLYGPAARITLWKYSNQQWQMVGDR